MTKITLGIPDSFKNNSEQIYSTLKKCLSQIDIKLVNHSESDSEDWLQNKKIDLTIAKYDIELAKLLYEEEFLATSLPACDNQENPFGPDKLVLKFLRHRQDIIDKLAPYFGRVWFVGAGAGNKELITVKGRNKLQEANAVISDYLLDQSMLKCYVNKEANVLPLTTIGKRIHKNQVSQHQINEAILRYALLVKKVVRLKGGDSFVFGRGGEECEYLLPYRVNYEVVPGISAMLSALGYAGIPLTHRNYNGGFLMITGYRQKNDDLDDCNAKIVDKINAALKHDLVVGLYMALSNWKNFYQMIEKQDMPLALIEWGGYENQRISLTTVREAQEVLIKENFQSPTLIVIGENVRVREKIKWFEKLPLYDTRVLSFASEKLSIEISDMLANLGAYSKSYELYDLVPENLQQTKSYYQSLNNYDYLLITSRNAFDIFFHNLKQLAIDVRNLPKIIVTGEKTEEEFRKIGIIPDIVPENFSSDGIISELSKIKISSKRILFPKSSLAKGNISSYITEQGGMLDEFVLYKNKAKDLSEQIVNEIDSFQADYIIFTSSSSVDYFFDHFNKDKSLFTAVSMGNKTTSTLKKHGITKIIEPDKYTVEGIKNLLILSKG